MYYINGQYVKAEDAKISILDLSILRGVGVFDFLRTYGGRPFHLEEHLLRLCYSAEQVGLTLPTSLEEIEEIVHALQRYNALPEANIKIVVTGGVSPDQFTVPASNTLIVLAYPVTEYPASHYTKGIKVITTSLSRSLPTSKTTQYLPAIVAMQKGRAQGASEALYLNARGEILEATTSNFFAFKGDTLHTCCSEEVLTGITREVLLRLAAPHYSIKTEALHVDELGQIDEAFITSSTREVMPVTQIDSSRIGNGEVGFRTCHLMELFRTYTQNFEWSPLDIPRYKRCLL